MIYNFKIWIAHSHVTSLPPLMWPPTPSAEVFWIELNTGAYKWVYYYYYYFIWMALKLETYYFQKT